LAICQTPRLSTTAGIGTSILPVRFGNPRLTVLLTLRGVGRWN
jgi:predicted MPP superfamily phosphohydrolase